MSACPCGHDRPLCFGCSAPPTFAVSLDGARLLEPVLACSAHVGDLMGNIVKSNLRETDVRSEALVKVTTLV